MKYPRDYIRPPYVQISIRTRLNMRDRDFGAQLADILWTSEPRYSPTKVELDFEKGTPCESREDFLDNWCVIKTRTYDGTDYQFPRKLWWKNRNSLKCNGSFGHAFIATTGAKIPGFLNVTFAFREKTAWKHLFLSLCKLMRPQLAMMHVFTEENCPPSKRESTFQTGSFAGLSDPKIPGLGWMFVGGEEFYQPLVDFDLADLDVQRTDCGRYCVLEIAKGAEEVLKDLTGFETRRDRLLEIFPFPIVKNYDALLD